MALAISVCGSLLLPLWGMAGNIETLTQQRYEGEVRVEGDGILVVTSAEGVQRVPLNQVRFARLNEPLFAPGNVPKGWHFEEIGDVQAIAYETNGLLILRGTGARPRDGKYQMAYFAYRVLRGDGE